MRNVIKRIPELDIFKGLAIVLVVSGHIILKNWEGALDSHPAYTWIYSFHMPIFFFISGFLIHYTFADKSAVKGLWRKSLALLVPYFVWCFLIDPFANRSSLPTLIYIFTDTHPKYWFVCLLFVFSALFYVGQMAIKGEKGVWMGGFLGFLFLGVAQYFYPCELFSRGLQFYPLYFFGVLASEYRLNENKLIYQEPLLSISLVAFFICSLCYCHVDNHLLNKLCKLLASFSICYIALFYMHKGFLNADSRLSKVLMYVGKNTIVIYLTHFFFVQMYPFYFFSEIQPTAFWSFVISIVMAVFIISFCLLIGRIVERFKWVNRFVYGRGWCLR